MALALFLVNLLAAIGTVLAENGQYQINHDNFQETFVQQESLRILPLSFWHQVYTFIQGRLLKKGMSICPWLNNL